MRTIETTMWSLALGLLLSNLYGCLPPCAPACGADQQEAGPEKAEGYEPGGSDKTRRMGHSKTESSGPAEIHNASKHAIIDAYRRCFDGCADKSRVDRPTCHNNCAIEVSAGSGDPAGSSCPRSCVKELGACLVPCEGRNADNEATCRIQCQALAENCVDGCN